MSPAAERRRNNARQHRASRGARSGDTSVPAGSLTLDRGLRILELLAGEPGDLSVAEIAKALGLNRQSVYRALKTLTEHRLATSSGGATYRIGVGVIGLASMYSPHLQSSIMPYLRRLAEETSATAHCAVADGDESVTLVVAEAPNTHYRFSYPPGSRHPLSRGASGTAILAGRPASAADSDTVKRARRLGYALTRGQITPGAIGIAAPLLVDGMSPEASVGIISIGQIDVSACAEKVVAVAAEIGQYL